MCSVQVMPYLNIWSDGMRHFYVILDNYPNWGFSHVIHLKSDVFLAYCGMEAFLLRSYGTLVITVRMDSALELCKGQLETVK